MVTCYRCSKTCDEVYYWDRQCCVKLCPSCIEYGFKLMSERERMTETFLCLGDHSLVLSSHTNNYFSNCAKCKQVSCIKFFCNLCNKLNLYCPSCYPLTSPDKCYLGHIMHPTPVATAVLDKLCHFCCAIDEAA